jgi:hypothetical protein
MVFNPGYLGLDSFVGYAEIPGLRISVSLVLWSLALHTVWSICVPIALIEAFDPTPTVRWLGRRGFAATAAVFVAGCVLLGLMQALEHDFVGSPLQFTVSAAAIVALVVAGLMVGRRSRTALPDRPRATPDPSPEAGRAPTLPRRAPAAQRVGLAAFALTSGYWLSVGLPLAGTPAVVAAVGCWLLAAASGWVVVARWSGRSGWGGRHRLALAAGTTATYAGWFGPSQAYAAGTPTGELVLGALVFGAAALVLVVAASLR